MGGHYPVDWRGVRGPIQGAVQDGLGTVFHRVARPRFDHLQALRPEGAVVLAASAVDPEKRHIVHGGRSG